MMNKNIFLSYCWSDKIDANFIDNIFARFGIQLTRDIRDLKYNTDIHKFMDQLKEHDKIIIYVSDSYLKSVNCMYEASQVLSMKDKVVIIIKDGTKIFNITDKENLISYWKEKFESISVKNPNEFHQEIADTKLAYQSIGKFIDFIKQDNRMTEKTLDFESIFCELQIEKSFSTIITKDVFDWIAKYPNANMFDVVKLISDLYKSTKIIMSEYPNIPDDEKPYYFKNISFNRNLNGIDISIKVQDVDSGLSNRISISHVVEIEENTNRSNQHSKYYFYYEEPSKKQTCMELNKKKEYSVLSKEEKRTLDSGYLNTYRMIIQFD